MNVFAAVTRTAIGLSCAAIAAGLCGATSGCAALRNETGHRGSPGEDTPIRLRCAWEHGGVLNKVGCWAIEFDANGDAQLWLDHGGPYELSLPQAAVAGPMAMARQLASGPQYRAYAGPHLGHSYFCVDVWTTHEHHQVMLASDFRNIEDDEARTAIRPVILLLLEVCGLTNADRMAESRERLQDVLDRWTRQEGQTSR